MEVTVLEGVTYFQVLGELLVERAESDGDSDVSGSAETVASVSVLRKNNFQMVARTFTSFMGDHCKKNLLEEVIANLEKERTCSIWWAQLCAADLVHPAPTLLGLTETQSSLSIQDACSPGSATQSKLVGFSPSPGTNGVKAHGDNCLEGPPQYQAGPAKVDRLRETLNDDLVQTTTCSTNSSGYVVCTAQPPGQTNTVFHQHDKVDFDSEGSSHCFIRRETLEALAQEASEVDSSPRSMSPESSSQSPWKTNSPRQCSQLRFGQVQGSSPVQSPSAQQLGLWHRLKQGLVDSPRAQCQLSHAPLKRPELKKASLQAVQAPLSPSTLHIAKENCSGKPAKRLLRTYIKSRDRKRSLCTFLEAAGPVKSDDVDELRAWSWVLVTAGATLRLKKTHCPELRYLLRIADFVSESGWPAPPAVLLLLQERMACLTSSNLFALLRHKEIILVKSLAEKLSAIVHTVLEWYFLHEATRVQAALDIGSTAAPFGQDKLELLHAALIEAFLTTAAHTRYSELKGHTDQLSNQLLLAHLTSAVATELHDQMQRYPPADFPNVNPVRTATQTFCRHLLSELHSLQTSSLLEVNRDFFTLFEALLDLDSAVNLGLCKQQPPAQIRIDTLPDQKMSPFLVDVCQVLEPYVIKWISSLSDQLLRWDQSLIVSLAKQTPTPGSKGKTSRSLRDLFDGVIRIVGSENAKMVYRSAPRYAALLDKALCRVILHRTQAIHALCQKVLSHASKEYHLPLPQALKKWRLPATGPVLSPNVCVLLNDMREVRARFSALVADITAPVRTKQTGTRTLSIAPANPEPTATARVPPRPPKKAAMSPVKNGVLSRMWNKLSGVSGPEKRTEGLGRHDKSPSNGTPSEKRLSGAGPRTLDGATGRKATNRISPSAEPERRAAKGDTGVSAFRDAVARSLSAPERELQGRTAEEQVLRTASEVPSIRQNRGKVGPHLSPKVVAKNSKSETAQTTGKVEKKGGKASRFFGKSAPKATRGGNEAAENGTDPTEDADLWADEAGKVLATSEERFSVLRVEIEKQYFELVRSIANMTTQDFAPFLEAVILGPDHSAPTSNPPNPWTRRAAALQEPTDFGLALDARRRLKPLLDYIMETFQDAWNLLDRSILRRLARDTWDSSAEALLGLLPSFHMGNATNIGGRRGLVTEDDDMPYIDNAVSFNLSCIDEAAPRLRKMGAVAAQLDELFGDLIVSASSSGEGLKKRAATGALPASEVPRNVKKLHKVLDVFAGLGSAASWSSTSLVR